jgi:hypothetical protein
MSVMQKNFTSPFELEKACFTEYSAIMSTVNGLKGNNLLVQWRLVHIHNRSNVLRKFDSRVTSKFKAAEISEARKSLTNVRI